MEKSYADLIIENVKLKAKIKRMEDNKIISDFNHAVAFQQLKKLMDDKVAWYENELQKSNKVASDAIALAKGVSHRAEQAQLQTEKVMKMIESQP